MNVKVKFSQKFFNFLNKFNKKNIYKKKFAIKIIFIFLKFFNLTVSILNNLK